MRLGATNCITRVRDVCHFVDGLNADAVPWSDLYDMVATCIDICDACQLFSLIATRHTLPGFGEQQEMLKSIRVRVLSVDVLSLTDVDIVRQLLN